MRYTYISSRPNAMLVPHITILSPKMSFVPQKNNKCRPMLILVPHFVKLPPNIKPSATYMSFVVQKICLCHTSKICCPKCVLCHTFSFSSPKHVDCARLYFWRQQIIMCHEIFFYAHVCSILTPNVVFLVVGPVEPHPIPTP